MRTLLPLLVASLLPGMATAAEQSDPFSDLLVLQMPPAATPTPALEEEPSAENRQIWFGKRVLVDTWDIVTSPLDWSGREWAIAGVAVGGTIATGLFVDREVRDESQEQHDHDRDRWSGAWGQLGTLYSLGALGAAGAYGWIADDERSVHTMVDGLEASIIASVILCPVLKYTVGRVRPNKAEQDSDNFDPFSGEASFPSGHTAQAFTVASVLAFSYDDHPLIGALAFTAASGVGLSRIHDDMHYASDVVAGAILGTWVGYEVVHFNRRRRGEEPTRSHAISDAEVDLILEGDRKGISLTWHW